MSDHSVCYLTLNSKMTVTVATSYSLNLSRRTYLSKTNNCNCYYDDKLWKEEKTPRERGRQKKALREQTTNDASNSINQQDTLNVDKEDVEDISDKDDQVWAPDSPIYVPLAIFSSPDVSDDDSINNTQVTTCTTMEVKTIDILNANNVLMICSERNKTKLGGPLQRHPLLFHFNRMLWPILFVTCQLKGLMLH